MNNNKLPIVLILSATGLILISILWIVLGVWGVHSRPLDWWGDVGGWIAGTTAPITGLLSAILLYLTFQKQQEKLDFDSERNKVIRDTERIRERFNDMIDLINSISYSPGAVQGTSGTLAGIGAIKTLCRPGSNYLSLYKEYFLFLLHLPIELKTSLEKIDSKQPVAKILATEEKVLLFQVINLYVQNVMIKTFSNTVDTEINAKLEELKIAYPEKVKTAN